MNSPSRYTFLQQLLKNESRGIFLLNRYGNVEVASSMLLVPELDTSIENSPPFLLVDHLEKYV